MGKSSDRRRKKNRRKLNREERQRAIAQSLVKPEGISDYSEPHIVTEPKRKGENNDYLNGSADEGTRILGIK